MNDSYDMTEWTTYSDGYFVRSLDALETALFRTPFYKAWRSMDPGASFHVDARYSALPIVTKKELRTHFPLGFVAEGCDLKRSLESREIEFVETSGTTEERMTTIWCQTWWNASEQASWRLNSAASRTATGAHREAILTNPLSTGVVGRDGPLPMARRRLGRFLYLNELMETQNWRAAHMDRMAAELAEFRPTVLEANPSLLAKLARHLADTGQTVYQPDIIILTYEYVSRLHLRQIQRAFRSPVASSYGSTETGYVFMECEAGCFHQNAEFCRVDFIPLRSENGGAPVGRIFVTPFGNPWMALLRFDIGDLVRLAEPATCPCGRNEGLILSAIEGRGRDVTTTLDGRMVTVDRLDETLSRVFGVVAYQLDQTASDAYTLRLVCDGVDPDVAKRVSADSMRGLYGGKARIDVQVVPHILPEVSGKHRLARPAVAVGLESLAIRR